MTARSVNDLGLLFLTGDLGGTEWPSQEFGAWVWDDPERFRLASPLTYAEVVHTPLLIQHSENDLRTTIGQAEAFFNRLRRLRRPVRLMRVPDETHELTRSGTPFRRVENLVQVREAWFCHYLVARRSVASPPIPRTRNGNQGLSPAGGRRADAVSSPSHGRPATRHPVLLNALTSLSGPLPAGPAGTVLGRVTAVDHGRRPERGSRAPSGGRSGRASKVWASTSRSG